ncbi:MAG: hypothetical protein KDA89_23225 [Planctomycetaceae bacterium]|nr:hypothetical protein [Planctomycetaceae bacterium]
MRRCRPFRKFRIFSLLTASLLTALSATTQGDDEVQPAKHALTVPTAAVPSAGASSAEEESTVQGDDPTKTRVTLEVKRILGLLGDDHGGDAAGEQIHVLFDPEAEDTARLEAADELEKTVGSLDMADRVQRSTAAQLHRRIRLVRAAVQALQASSADDDLRALVNDLALRAAVDFENTGRGDHAAIVRRRYDQLRQQYPAVYAKLNPVLLDDYMNYNLHFVLSEPMLSRLVTDFRTDSGNVADCILGAWVTGCQVTDTMVRADVKPSSGTASFQLIVDGKTRSDTQGRKDPATVYTHGDHSFTITKPTYFDGERITTGTGCIDVNARNQTVGLRTDYDRIPILRGIVRKIAWKEVQKKHGESQAIAARKLADQALPAFEREVGQKFDEANRNFQTNLLQKLRDKDLAPETYSARSSETHYAVSSRTMPAAHLAAPNPPYLEPPRRGVAVQMHESVLNTTIDSLGIGGEMAPTELITKIEKSLSEFLDRKVSLMDESAPPDDKTLFVFADSDPIRVRFDEGQVVFILRTGFRQTERNRVIPPHVFEIPVGIELSDGHLHLIAPDTSTRGILGLYYTAIEGRTNVQARVIAKQLLEKTFKEPRTKIDGNLEINSADNRKLRLRVTKFEITDGWVTSVLQ